MKSLRSIDRIFSRFVGDGLLWCRARRGALSRGALASEAVEELAKTTPEVTSERELVAGELALAAGELPEATRRLSAAQEILRENPSLEGPYRPYTLLAPRTPARGTPPRRCRPRARSARTCMR